MKTRKPFFWAGTHRQFRAAKRREWNAIIKAWEKYRVGCLFTPGYPSNTTALEVVLRQQKEALRGDWKAGK